jgi:GT2 family glycosyltransferase
MTTVHILTAVHNDLNNLKKLLNSIYRQSIKKFTVTVVDDGSTDGTKHYLQENNPSIHIISGNGNLWWTGSINAGLEQILGTADESDYVLTINNDCTIKPDYLKKILSVAGSDKIIGSKVVSAQTNKTWDLGERIDWAKGTITIRQKDSDPVDAITTKGTLYPVTMFKQIGLLSKRLPHYLSDYEIAIRAKHRGYKLIICSACIVTNDTQNTGEGDIIPDKVSFKQGLKLLFSRKSKVNIFDQFWFITLSCPIEYKLSNYLWLLKKLVKGYNQLL